MAKLEIRLLGGLQIRHDDAEVTQFISSKVPALLAYLAVTRRPHQRDALAGLLWGEMPDTAAANNLRQALTNLRKLCDPHLLITRDTVALNLAEPHFVDVDALTDGLRLSAGQPAAQHLALLHQAVTLYQGEFLEGFYVRDAPDFEDWVLVQRVHLRELALQGWNTLTTLLLDGGDYEGASEAAGRLLAMDPWREEAHRQRMLALARSGQRSAALAQYQACRAILAKEFDAEPEAATTALYQRIRAATRGPRHNLPALTTGFVGRAEELADLRRLLASPQTRLVTVLGPGGVGKTRLALEAAAACAPMFLNGVWFVSWAGAVADHPAALVAAVADALQLTLSGADDPQKQTLDFLRPRELLLILDDLENLGEGADWLGQVLAAAPDVKILVTSRERLDLQAERVYVLDGLSVPPVAVTDAENYAAVQLFVRRAQRVQPDFALDAETAAHISHICRLVQGLPLAVELAAAWVRQLSCAEIADQIERNLDFLATTRRDVVPRQRSLRAVFDWSWSRLTPDVQAAFQRLAVFRGPFSRAAALLVANASLPIMATLADKSLVWRRGNTYELHEVARHFAGEKLSQAGTAPAIQARHAAYYGRMLAHNAERFKGSDQKQALHEVEGEIENVRAAWLWLVEQRDVTEINAALDGLYHFMAIRSRFREGLEVFDTARCALAPLVETSRAARLAHSRATARAGRFLSFLSRFDEAQDLLYESLAALRTLNERDEMAYVLGHLGGTMRMQGDLAQAEQLLQECLALRQETGNQHGQAVALLELGGVAFMAADFERARARCQQGLTVAESAGDLQTMAHLLTGLSLSFREQGQTEQALAFGRRGLAIYEELTDRYGMIQAALTLGELSRQLGNYEDARRFSEQAVLVSQEIGHRSGEAEGHYRLGQIAAGLGERDEALRQLRLALQQSDEIQETPLILDILLEIGCLLMSQDAQRASLILAYLLDQPIVPDQGRARARATLAQVSAQTRASAAAPLAASLEAIVALASTG